MMQTPHVSWEVVHCGKHTTHLGSEQEGCSQPYSKGAGRGHCWDWTSVSAWAGSPRRGALGAGIGTAGLGKLRGPLWNTVMRGRGQAGVQRFLLLKGTIAVVFLIMSADTSPLLGGQPGRDGLTSTRGKERYVPPRATGRSADNVSGTPGAHL
jgi:hypothetical protein